MLIKDSARADYFMALDKTLLCELLHPEREPEPLKMGYSLAQALLKPGRSSLPHKLKTASEVYYILEGEGLLVIGEESERVRPGQAVYIPPASVQFLRNTGKQDLKFLCLVSPPWRIEEEELCQGCSEEP
jgi:mannose-6-phosphate isomerase-like protein (cupin superfamily)